MDSYPTNTSTQEQASLRYNNEFKDTPSFLEALRLSQYTPTFIDEGFESISAVREITESDLIALNVKRGHRRVIQRGIATLNGVSPKQPLMIGITSVDLCSKTNNTGNNSSEGSYTTSGYDSMRSPKAALTMNPQYESSNSSQYASNSSNSLYQKNQSKQQSYLNQEGSSGDNNNNTIERMEIDNDVDDKDDNVIDSIRSSSFSSNDDEGICNTNQDRAKNNALKRKYRRHPRPDRDAPIKPPSAYIMFSNDARAKLKEHNMTFVEIAKIVGDQWKNLSSSKKKQYERTAMKAKDDYLDALNDYRQTDKYKKYQIYLNNFKSEQDATNRKIARLRKKNKRESPGSGSMGGSSSNGNDSNNSKDKSSDISLDTSNSTSTDGGSTNSNSNSTDGGSNEQYGSQTNGSSSSNSSDIYKVHLKNNPPPPSIITTDGCNKKDIESSTIEEEETNGDEYYSPQQTAPPLVDENVSKSSYERLPLSNCNNEPPTASTASQY